MESGVVPKIIIIGSFPKSPLWKIASGGSLESFMALFMPHLIDDPSLFLIYFGSFTLS
jgi:hypothetical protein